MNFIISGSTVANLRRLRNGDQQQHSRIEEAESQLYRDLAQTSGGQAVEVTTSEVSEVIGVLTEFNSASLVALPNVSPQVLQRCSVAVVRLLMQAFVPKLQVTLLQAARNPGKTDTFTFLVDQTVENPVVYITGRSVTFVLTNPTGNPAPCRQRLSLHESYNSTKYTFVKLQLNVHPIYFSGFFLLSLFNMETVLSVKERNPETLVPSCAILQIPSALVNVFLRIVCLQESLSRAATRPGR